MGSNIRYGNQSHMSRYFISGHIDISWEKFLEEYKFQLDTAISIPDSSFVVGDADGVDNYAQRYLAERIPRERISVYYCKERPRNNSFGLRTVGGFRNHTAKDEAMTLASDIDILWVRSDEETRAMYGSRYRAGRISGTEKNRIRRLRGVPGRR